MSGVGSSIVSFVDRVVGVYHFVGDRAPRNIPLVAPKPRAVNPWCRNGKALVARVMADETVKTSVDRVIALLGQLGQAVSRGDKVLVKPNFNSPDPYPGSTDLVFLRAILELLMEAGARVIIGESSGAIWRPTRNVFRKFLEKQKHSQGKEVRCHQSYERAQEVDRTIFTLVNYPTVKMIGRVFRVMFTAPHRLERTDFIFTRRT